MNIEGRRIETLWIAGADAQAPPLVFLHEGLGSLGLWRDVPRRLVEATGASALVYSRYGNGFSGVLESARPVAYMHEEALEALPALLDHFAIRRPVLVGHSDGASIALIHAAQHPVRALILEAPHVFVEELSLRSIAAVREPYLQGELRRRLARHHADVDRTFFGWNDVWLSPEFRGWNIEAYAARISAPTFLLQGQTDEYGSRAQLQAIRAAAQGPVDELLLAGCGHTPHRDRPDLVLPAIAAYVRTLTAASASGRPLPGPALDPEGAAQL
ncbi:MAG: alpha/beta hydrolase [bacterium]|nr:alpha/beta hydrolase [bacterium]